jgi:hypothetical protein
MAGKSECFTRTLGFHWKDIETNDDTHRDYDYGAGDPSSSIVTWNDLDQVL